MNRIAEYVGDGRLAVSDLPTAPPAAGEVQIAVAFTGLCGTDLHILHGNMDSRNPGIIGHEMSGRVAALGPGVDGLRVGAPVTVMPLDWCGSCPACAAGNEHICHNLNFVGIDSPGSLQNLWNVRADLVLELPDSIDLRSAALVEPIAVAAHDVGRGRLAAGERAVVVGGGPIGALIATVAREKGAEVLVLEVDAGRRAGIESLGFRVLDPTSTDQTAAVLEWTAGAGADVVFEASGSAPGIAGATGLARARGRIVIVGIHPTPRPVDLQRVFWRELELYGARVYTRADFEEAIRLLAGGKVPADALITAVTPLSEVRSAFTALESGQAMKVLIDCQDGASAAVAS